MKVKLELPTDDSDFMDDYRIRVDARLFAQSDKIDRNFNIIFFFIIIIIKFL